MSRWRSTIVRGCAVGMVSTTGKPIGKQWLVYTNSTAVYDELQSLSRCTCGQGHARVEGGDTVRSGHYTPRFAIAAHRAFRRWITDRARTSWKSICSSTVLADVDLSMVALTQSIRNQLQRLLPKSTTQTDVFTNDEEQLLHDILHLAKHALVPISFASIQVNMYLKAVRMPWHYDLKNCGDTNLNWVKTPQGCRHKVHPLSLGIRISFVSYTPQSLHLLPRSDLELVQQCGFPVSH
eukprot:1838022-Amphidinium_carterae.1